MYRGDWEFGIFLIIRYPSPTLIPLEQSKSDRPIYLSDWGRIVQFICIIEIESPNSFIRYDACRWFSMLETS